jgi:hypothetical protein
MLSDESLSQLYSRINEKRNNINELRDNLVSLKQSCSKKSLLLYNEVEDEHISGVEIIDLLLEKIDSNPYEPTDKITEAKTAYLVILLSSHLEDSEEVDKMDDVMDILLMEGLIF